MPYLAGDMAGAGRLLDEALFHARRAGQAKLVIELRATLLPMRLYLATPLDRLRAEALGLVTDARSAGRRSAEAAAQVTLGEVAWLQDDLDAAEGHFAEGNRLSLEVGFTRKRLWSLLGRSQVAIARDQPDQALRLAQEAVALTTQADGSADVEAELHLAEACLAGADPGGAAAAVARAWAVLQEVDVFSRARLQRTEAKLALASGDPARAVALLERSLAALETTGHRLDQLHTLAELAPALRRVGHAEEAGAVASARPGDHHGRPRPGPPADPGRGGKGLGDDPTAIPGRGGGAAPGARPEPDLPPWAARRPGPAGQAGDPVRLPGGQLPDAPGRTRRPRAGADRRRGGDRLPVRGGELVHTIIRAGNLIGELALLNDGRRTAGARATSPTTAWAIGRDPFWGFLEANPPASSALLRQVAARLATREALIDDLLSLDVKSRLAKVLLGLADEHGQPDPDGGTRISLRLTHRDLAGMVGASRENVSRALGAFRKRGFIDYDSDSIRLRNPDALRLT